MTILQTEDLDGPDRHLNCLAPPGPMNEAFITDAPHNWPELRLSAAYRQNEAFGSATWRRSPLDCESVGSGPTLTKVESSALCLIYYAGFARIGASVFPLF